MKRLAALLLLLAVAGCDVEPYPFGTSDGDGSARLVIQITPRGSGRWITSDGTQYYACYFDAEATVTGSNPRSWITAGGQDGDSYGTYIQSTLTGSTGGQLNASHALAGLFHTPAPLPLGPGGGGAYLAVGETGRITNVWVGDTRGPFTFSAELHYQEQGGRVYNQYVWNYAWPRVYLDCR